MACRETSSSEGVGASLMSLDRMSPMLGPPSERREDNPLGQ